MRVRCPVIRLEEVARRRDDRVVFTRGERPHGDDLVTVEPDGPGLVYGAEVVVPPERLRTNLGIEASREKRLHRVRSAL